MINGNGCRSHFSGVLGLACLVFSLTLLAQPIPPGTEIEVPDAENWAMLRMLNEVQRSSRWASAKTVSERLTVMRSHVGKLAAAGDPISDRYVLTCYAGAVDMRHFLYTAIKVLTERNNREYWKGNKYDSSTLDDAWRTFKVSEEILKKEGPRELHIQRALYDTFCVELGPEYERLKVEDPVLLNKRVKERYWQATVEDFPSSALGALFAKYYLLGKNDDLDLDLKMEFTRFILPFKPVPDQIRTKMSYAEFVKGFERSGDKKKPSDLDPGDDHLFIHFTALPLNNTRLINKIAEEQGYGKFCEDCDDPHQALALAGVRLVDVAYKYPLRLEYIKADEQ